MLALEMGADAQDIARALAGRITLERYRGRTAYSQRVQAAELAVREAERLAGVAEKLGAACDRFGWDGDGHSAVSEGHTLTA